jgi:superfamily II DNA or RNA helicase
MQCKPCKISAVMTMNGLLIRRNVSDMLDIPTKAVINHTKFIGKNVYTTTAELYRHVRIQDKQYCLLARFALVSLSDLYPDWLPEVTYKNTLLDLRKPKSEVYEPGVDLLENQNIAWKHLKKQVYNPENINRGLAGCILVMDTGLGKTYMGGAFIEYVRCKTLILVPNTTPIKEWRQMLNLCFPKLTVGQYHSKSKCDGDVVIMTINSALGKSFQVGSEKLSADAYLCQFGAVIYDEVHDYAAPKRKEIFWKFNPLMCLGLTATPDERADGMDAVTYAHVGPVVRADKIPGFNVEEIVWIGEVQVVKYSGPADYTHAYKNSQGWNDTQKMCEQFIADPYRNKLLIQQISKLYEQGKNIFVFSDRREYLHTLQNKLFEHNIVNEAPETQKLMGGATEEDKLNAENRARVILITYGYGIQSLSIPKMDAIVFATPRRRKMRQTLGRILRRSGDPTSKRIIVDIVDEATSMRSQYSTRKQIYKKKGFTIITSEVSYNLL